jgi:hypothetical protein
MKASFPQTILIGDVSCHLARASSEVARYDSFLGVIPDRDLLLSPMLTAEAANSSRIEGTRATMSDVLAYEAGIIFNPSEPPRVSFL